MQITETIHQNPYAPAFPEDALADCIQACLECAQICAACADACTGEDNTRALVKCIRLNLDCADVCMTTARMLSRQQSPDPALLNDMVAVCARACSVCADECDLHAREHDHCKITTQACRRCEIACRAMPAARVPGVTHAHAE